MREGFQERMGGREGLERKDGGRRALGTEGLSQQEECTGQGPPRDGEREIEGLE